MDALDFETAVDVITRLMQKEAEKRLWDVWLIMYPRMTEENFESFADYKARLMCKKPEVKHVKTKAEILAEIQKIRSGKVVGTHGDF